MDSILCKIFWPPTRDFDQQFKPWVRNWTHSVQFSHSVMSNSYNPGLQHTRLPCPSPTPRACSNSGPLSWWCHPPISSPVVCSPPAFSFPQHQGLFPMSQFFASRGQSIGASAGELNWMTFKIIPTPEGILILWSWLLTKNSYKEFVKCFPCLSIFRSMEFHFKLLLMPGNCINKCNTCIDCFFYFLNDLSSSLFFFLRFIYLFYSYIFGYTGSLLLCTGFL